MGYKERIVNIADELKKSQSKYNLVYKPPLTCREKVDIIFPWLGKEWKVKEIPYKGKNE